MQSDCVRKYECTAYTAEKLFMRRRVRRMIRLTLGVITRKKNAH